MTGLAARELDSVPLVVADAVIHNEAGGTLPEKLAVIFPGQAQHRIVTGFPDHFITVLSHPVHPPHSEGITAGGADPQAQARVGFLQLVCQRFQTMRPLLTAKQPIAFMNIFCKLRVKKTYPSFSLVPRFSLFSFFCSSSVNQSVPAIVVNKIFYWFLEGNNNRLSSHRFLQRLLLKVSTKDF